MDEGYIKLYRSLLKWEWIDNPNVLTLFIHCLLRANYQDTRWQGIELKKGSFVTSYDKLSKATGLTIKQVRNGIAKLEQSGEIRADKGQGKKPTIISVCKYEQYQQGQIKGTLRADKGHIEGTKGATDNNIKNINNINNNPYSNYIYNARESLNVVQSKPEKKIFADKVRVSKAW